MANKIYEYLRDKAAAERRPLTVNLELLPACNLDCRMCYIRSDFQKISEMGGLLPKERWIAMAKEFKAAGAFFLLLSGGEAFLYPEFKDLYIELYNMGFAITINTNATLINEKVVEWLSFYPPKAVSISLYGADDETYEKVTGKKGVFQTVDHNIRLLKDAGITITLKTILTPLNFDNLPKCIEYTKNINIHYEVATYAFPPVRKLGDRSQLRFTPEQAVQASIVSNMLMSEQSDFEREILRYLYKYNKHKDDPCHEQYGMTCAAANTSVWINWQGRMLACALLDNIYTLPFEVGFEKAWQELKNRFDQLKISSECSHCDKREVCSVCPAALYAENNSLDRKSEYHCAMTNNFLYAFDEYVRNHNLRITEDNEGSIFSLVQEY